MGARAEPSPLFRENADRLAEAAKRGPVLDLACGRGRHALAAAELGCPTLALDRNIRFLTELRQAAVERKLRLGAIRTDLETPHGIPVRPRSCGAILVFRFLFRPLAPSILQALRPGGLLLYETFTRGQAELGWGPSNPAFLLAPGELPTLFADLEILSSWEGVSSGPRPEAVARLVAQRPG